MARGYASYPSHTVINMPALSPTMTQGNIGAWKKQIGDTIVPGDVLVEIETDKAQMEFECQEEGILAKILLEQGAKDVPVGSPIAVMCEEASDVAQFKDFAPTAAAAASKAAEAAPAAVPAAAPTAAPAAAAAPASAPAAAPAAAAPAGRVFASPLARTLAAQNNLPLNTIQGTGPNSRVIAADVQRTLAQPAASVAAAAAPAAPVGAPQASTVVSETETPFEDVPLTNMRKVIAQRLGESKATIPHYYLTATVTMDRALKLREVLNAKLAAAGQGKLSVNDLVVKASALALGDVPAVNAAWWPATGSVRQFKRADIAVAVATDAGLITPIVRGADAKGLKSISAAVRDLAGKAKANKLAPHEYQGGSFTISNLGMYGSVEHFTAIINPPQAAILAIGGMDEKIVRVPGKDNEFTASQVMKVTLSCDHRVVDGAVSAQWLAAFKKYLEEPLNMLL
ncbi:pyruvate dehydrogenase complex dihydrolipoamide acetyltransferase [Allomyces macrogynus ATCC 38327]|uniref:Acetyltransferase component of pyruvate dehydrogenase complex n=1 Tax=Allomyces macrogynus (strain ATCC 38327) TaxID=578462 RepID=A0A0L0S6R7_ALLM3|nr:pyruvate dehydrogenase complex dihydrolipoamide acetyltransferase [Allomyces macrogynus ATCC 38327]|eukprot:KNE58313.1 pyruvate dehydrogenase complex dihydrolipoamide acetyltransferase [Allomyces macrogynus ATCC 38327]